MFLLLTGNEQQNKRKNIKVSKTVVLVHSFNIQQLTHYLIVLKANY